MLDIICSTTCQIVPIKSGLHLAGGATPNEDNAYANIAKIFQSDIKIEEEILKKYKEIEIGKRAQLSSSVDLISNYSIGSSQTLKNVKIAETYISAEDGLYYVLAYLDRMETALIYEREIERNNQIIQEYYQHQFPNHKVRVALDYQRIPSVA